jgi:hypothetical protein
MDVAAVPAVPGELDASVDILAAPAPIVTDIVEDADREK